MPTTNFSSGTVISSTWLNEVDEHVFNGHGNVIYVTDQAYGAVGDGITDDTAAVQLALDAAEASNGYVVFTKIFAISEYITVRNGVRGLIGLGGGIKCIASANDAGILLLGPEDGATDPVSNCVIKGMYIDLNNRATTSNGIYAQNANNCVVVDNRIVNRLVGHGIIFYSFDSSTACYNNVIARNVIQGEQATIGAESTSGWMSIAFNSEVDFGVHGSQDIYWKSTFTVAVSSVPNYANSIVDNHITGGYYGIMSHSSRWNLISNNWIAGVVRGISVQDTGIGNSVIGNTIFNCRSSALHLAYGSISNTISNNTVYSTISVGESLLQAYVGCDYNTFRDNKVICAGASTPQYYAYTAVHSNQNVFANNDFYGPAAKAYIGVESAWDTTLGDAAHRATGSVVGVNNCANTGMSGNIIEGNTINGSSAVPAIVLSQISDGGGNYALSATRVCNNTILNNTPSKQLYLIEENSGSLSSVVLTGNLFDTSATASKFTFPRGRAHCVAIHNNTVLDEATAPVAFTNADATPSVLAGRWFQCANVGATNITMFDDGNDGQEITIRLDVNTTIVHNASNIKCQGAANITGRNADDHVTFKRLGGIWFEIARSW